MGKIKIEENCPSCQNMITIKLVRLQNTDCICPKCKSELTVIIDNVPKIVRRIRDNDEPLYQFHVMHTFADDETRERIRMIDGTDTDDWLRNPRIWI